jgi:EpsI family protein
MSARGRLKRYYGGGLLALIGAGICVQLLQYWLYTRPVQPLAAPLSECPKQIAGWEAVSVGLDEEIESVLHLQDYWSATYRRPNEGYVSLLIGYYADESVAKLHQPTVCYPGAGWTLRTIERTRLAAARGEDIEMNRLIVERGEDRQIVLYWFHAPGATMADPSMSKLHLLKRCLEGNLSRSLVKVQIAAPVIGSPDETISRIAPFVREVVSVLAQRLGPDWGVPELETVSVSIGE